MEEIINKRLISDGLLTEAQLRQAEEKAGETDLSEQVVLVSSNLVDPSGLGRSIAAAYELPYMGLESSLQSGEVCGALAKFCAKAWNVFPVRYNPRSGLLTVAISDIEQAEKLQKIYGFLLEQNDVAFVVASEPEIKEMIDKFCCGKATKKVVSSSSVVTHSEKRNEGKQLLTSLHKRMEATRQREEEEPAQPVRSDVNDMLEALKDAAELLCAAHLGENTTELAKVRSRARYCNLIAVRLSLSQEETARTVIAAWLSGIEDNPHVIDRFAPVLDIKSVIFPDNAEKKQAIEHLILTLVRCYENIEKERPEESDDVNLVRRGLLIRWSDARTQSGILEVFLQVLMDEQFLDKLGKVAGTVMLFDPTGAAASEVETQLRRSGYRVDIFSDENTAKSAITEEAFDFALLYSDQLNADKVLALCRQIKSEAETVAAPVIAIVPPESPMQGVDFLRGGADDFVTAPVDIELLLLRIAKQKKEQAPVTESASDGVSGSLSDLSLSDMLQVLSAGSRSMQISLTSGDLTGQIFLKKGNVIHVRAGETTGEQAFYQLMRWPDGDFAMKECEEFPEPDITSSTMSLLMEGARLADEATG